MYLLELYTYPCNNRAMMALIAAEYNHIDIKVPEFNFGVENKTPEFLALNPNGQVPTLKTPQGGLFESTAIARYVARMRADTELMGASFYEQAQVDQWIDWCNCNVVPTINQWFYTCMGYLVPNPKVIKTASEDLKKYLQILNEHLVNNTYMVGNKITLADIVLVCYLLNGFKFLFEESYRAPYASLLRWFLTCPEFYAVMGQVDLSKEEKPKKEEKAKKEQKPKKEEKKPKAEEPEDDMMEEEKPKKKVQPFSDLAPTPFVLDTWLKIYSNTKTNFYSVMDQFWPMFDKEGWSIWFCDYLYNDENLVGFKTANLVSGFIQRSDEVRKYGFGNMNILKNDDEKFYTIRGCWLFRGQGNDFMLEVNPDAECYKWTKVVDYTDADKQKIADMWCASEQIEGQNIVSNEVFK
ncbi:hypothetical protein WA158_005145 [Blastocystis sp. Blastoise]